METTSFQTPWVLWYHDPENKDYSLSGYELVAEIWTPQQLWSLVDAITKDAWDCGMFFFMKKGIRPLWDCPENANGGSWSKKINVSDVHTVFIDLMIRCVADELLVQKKDTLAGITISPKGPFSIVKIWNTNSSLSDRGLLNKQTKMLITDDVTYTPHKLRRK